MLLNRFHYSMDVVMAVLLTFLFFSNGVIAEASKRWMYAFINRKQNPWKPDQEKKRLKKFKEALITLESEIKVAMELPQDQSVGVTIVQTKELLSSGEVFIPPCMHPLRCCRMLWQGEFAETRHHLYNDKDLSHMLIGNSRADQMEMSEHMRLSLRHDMGWTNPPKTE